ncbi:rod shape-determining protein MreC [Trinickia terrae]|uniref:Cell shape-determining protein MreC n=1 Tax=Trinickia terrae TaxID=2571161 RepID=A0A4V5PHJ2_9BURK|nr:rod shape-determining protein MreC [Trinickia terrae]TKC83610.1 rod shape-determining protein MreC [Trinickia terrae]
MEYSPPPLFKQGPSALARLVFFVVLALALLISDARFRTLEIVRGVLGAGLYPLQRAALVPRDVFMGAADLAVTSATLRTENQKLTARNLQLSTQANQTATLEAENAHLRALLDLTQQMTTKSTPAEIQYDTADPFTQKVVIGVGSHQDVQNGSPVVNENGVVGQVTRVFPMQSEVTLLTDKDQAVPVQVVRTGLRSVIYGTPKGDALEMRFVPISADVLAGDELVTSGLDGVYPPGLPVAKVARVDKLADTAFARVVCQPVATVRGAKQFLVLHYISNVPPRPEEPESASTAAGKDAKNKKAVKAADKDKAAGKTAPDAKAGENAADKTAKTPTAAKSTEKNAKAPAADHAAASGAKR